MVKLYDLVCKKLLKKHDIYDTSEFRQELRKFRLSRDDIRELEKDLIFIGEFERKNRYKIKRKRKKKG